MPAFLVCEGAAPEELADAVRARARAGTRVTRRWEAPRADEAVLCVGRVETAQDAATAVLAAMAGADLVIDAVADRDVIDQLCDDLRQLGTLDHQIGSPAPSSPLSAEERALLAELLAGRSLGEAARALHISRRTADRRLASARELLGATSTSQALIAAQRMGVTPSREPAPS